MRSRATTKSQAFSCSLSPQALDFLLEDLEEVVDEKKTSKTKKGLVSPSKQPLTEIEPSEPLSTRV